MADGSAGRPRDGLGIGLAALALTVTAATLALAPATALAAGRSADPPRADANPAPATAAAPSIPAGGQADGKRPREVEDRLREFLNRARRANGLAPLAGDPVLDRLARAHAREMARLGQVTHHSEEYGIGTQRRVRLAFPDVGDFAENVARNRDAERLHRALMASPGHRANRLAARFTHVGIGTAFRGGYEVYVTELFVAASRGRGLGPPQTLYTDLSPGDLAREEAPRSHVGTEAFSIRGPAPGGTDDPEAWTQRGIDEFERGDYGAAVRAFRGALRVQPDYHYARFNLGRALIRAGRPDEAITVLAELLEARPDDVDARRSLGSAALLAGRYDEAEVAFRRVLAARPREAGTWYNLGLALEYQDRPDGAAVAYRQALHIDPGLAAAVAGLARVGEP